MHSSLPADGTTPALARRLNLPLLTLYGFGAAIGAGIHALMGEVAARAGMAAPLSFLIAALIAPLSALSFVETAARYPHSAGEALCVAIAFGLAPLAEATSVTTLLVFTAVNAAAYRIKRREPKAPGAVAVPPPSRPSASG